MRKPISPARVPKLPPRPVKSRLRKTPVRPDLSIEQILKWADAHFARHGKWPFVRSGRIPETIDENWQRIDMALHVGARSLPRNSGLTLARLLEKHRGVRNPIYPPRLSLRQILGWARSHHARTGAWPTADSGQIVDAPEENWRSVDGSMRNGTRGLPRGSSLARLLARHCGVRNISGLPRLSYAKILKWCDAHKKRTGRWPTNNRVRVHEDPAETWQGIDVALRNGSRGLQGGTSLARLLAEKRGKRVRGFNVPPLSEAKILNWCDAHHRRKKAWPIKSSRAVAGSPDDTWAIIDDALRHGRRGLAGGSSLADLLARKRQVPNRLNMPRLSFAQILTWADTYFAKHGRWPNVNSGHIEGTYDDTWSRMDNTLRDGSRGLPKDSGMTLARLLERHRGVRNSEYPPELSERQILKWAKAHRRRTGKLPTAESGPIQDAPGETWGAIDNALRRGHRGLPREHSLHRFLLKSGQ